MSNNNKKKKGGKKNGDNEDPILPKGHLTFALTSPLNKFKPRQGHNNDPKLTITGAPK